MGTYTPNYNLYKPDVGEVGWGNKVNANFDTIDEEMYNNRSDINNILNNLIPSLQTDVASNKTIIQKIKTELLSVALKVQMNQALLNAESKDFYSIIADVITSEYPYGYKSTFETITAGVIFDNDGGGYWIRAIKIPITVSPTEDCQYILVLTIDTLYIYTPDGTLKASFSTESGVTDDFWSNVKSDGSDIRFAIQGYTQIYFYIEKFDYAAKEAIIHVKIPANATELYIAYGNALAEESSYNDPNQVFELFDDLEDQDISDWTVYDGEWIITSDAYHGNYALKRNNVGIPVDTIGKSFIYNRDHDIQIRFAVRLTENEGITPLGFLIRNKAENDGYLFEFGKDDNPSKIQLWIAGLIVVTLGESVSGIVYNVWYDAEIIIKTDGTIIFRDGTGSEIVVNDTTYSYFDEICFRAARQSIWDFLRISKLIDSCEFGEASVTKLDGEGDFITVTFDFADGVDKLLITADTDAQTVYYSVDDGATWIQITPDEEMLLPETAYSIKWKFESATYLNGYAFITW